MAGREGQREKGPAASGTFGTHPNENLENAAAELMPINARALGAGLGWACRKVDGFGHLETASKSKFKVSQCHCLPPWAQQTFFMRVSQD